MPLRKRVPAASDPAPPGPCPHAVLAAGDLVSCVPSATTTLARSWLRSRGLSSPAARVRAQRRRACCCTPTSTASRAASRSRWARSPVSAGAARRCCCRRAPSASSPRTAHVSPRAGTLSFWARPHDWNDGEGRYQMLFDWTGQVNGRPFSFYVDSPAEAKVVRLVVAFGTAWTRASSSSRSTRPSRGRPGSGRRSTSPGTSTRS